MNDEPKKPVGPEPEPPLAHGRSRESIAAFGEDIEANVLEFFDGCLDCSSQLYELGLMNVLIRKHEGDAFAAARQVNALAFQLVRTFGRAPEGETLH